MKGVPPARLKGMRRPNDQICRVNFPTRSQSQNIISNGEVIIDTEQLVLLGFQGEALVLSEVNFCLSLHSFSPSSVLKKDTGFGFPAFFPRCLFLAAQHVTKVR